MFEREPFFKEICSEELFFVCQGGSYSGSGDLRTLARPTYWKEGSRITTFGISAIVGETDFKLILFFLVI